jgi:integrase/recombinase XerD
MSGTVTGVGTGTLDLAGTAAQYLGLRRALGYKLARQGELLLDFVGYLQAVGAGRVTIEHALAWATLPTRADPVWWSARLGVVRGFARYLHALDPATEVPPVGLLPDRDHRVTPYIYTDDDLARLLTAAGQLRPALRAATYQTLIGLLAVTGMRVGEAIGLDRGDLDPAQRLLTIRHGKFGKSRQLPLHESTVEALLGYAALVHAQRRPTPRGSSLLVSTTGTRLIGNNASAVFSRLVREARLDWSGRRRPRLHDLRHRFAVLTVLGWYRTGVDVEPRLPLLSTWLGHIGPASTYWYLSAVPELLALAAQRVENAAAQRVENATGRRP